MKTSLVPLFTALAMLGCAGLTAEEHRQKADQEQAAATAEEKQYDPHARAQAYEGGPAMVGKGPFDVQPDTPPRLATYNPTERYLEDAEAHRHAADSHLKAALELEHFEDAACTSVSKEARAGCPLLSPKIAVVEETAQGVRLRVKPGVDVNDLAKTMSCHLAFARAHGYDAPSCPLYRAGVSLGTTSDGAIELRSASAKTAADLRADARKLFVPGPTTVSRDVH